MHLMQTIVINDGATYSYSGEILKAGLDAFSDPSFDF